MKKALIVLLAFMAITVFAFVACNSDKAASKNSEGLTQVASMNIDNRIQRGQYLVTIMGCNDCHSPKKMGPMGPEVDSSLMLSGHPASMPLARVDAGTAKSWILFNQNLTAFVGPWGASFAANLTSDETGIGNWTEKQFLKAIREGKYKGMDNSRPLLPPMPWTMYRNASDEDLKAIFAYLKSTKPVSNRVPPPIPPDQLANQN